MRGEGGHSGEGGSGRKRGSESSEAITGCLSSNGLVGAGSSRPAETDVASTIDEWIYPPPTLTSKQFSGGSQFTVITLVAPERLEYERENPCHMFGVVWAVDTLRASETRTDMAEGEFLSVTSPSFLPFLNN